MEARLKYFHQKFEILEEGTYVTCCVTGKHIPLEYRFWIVDGQIITSSLYKMGSRVVYSPIIDKGADWFAMSMIHPMCLHSWNPARAFCLDIAMIEENGEVKYKIIEINNINSAGLYAANIPSLVMALECLKN